MDKDKLIEILELFLVEHTQALGMKLMKENYNEIEKYLEKNRLAIQTSLPNFRYPLYRLYFVVTINLEREIDDRKDVINRLKEFL